MEMIERIRAQFEASARSTLDAADRLAEPIAAAVDLITSAFAADNKLLICGNGACAADSQRLAAALVGRFERERPELCAVALSADGAVLTAIAHDDGFDRVFARQVQALGRDGDVLVVLTEYGDAPDLLAAASVAHERGMSILAMTGQDGGRLAAMLGDGDLHLCVPQSRVARIREVQLLILHCLCDGIDAVLLGDA